jgi:hypothetical protein
MDSILINNFGQDQQDFQDIFSGFPDESLKTSIAFGDK